MTSFALTLTLALNALQPQEVPPLIVAPQMQPRRADLEKYSDRRVLGIGMLALGSASILAGITTGLYIMNSELEDTLCGIGDVLGGEPTCPQHDYTKEKVATAVTILGGAGLVIGGVTTMVFATRRLRELKGLTIQAAPIKGGAAANLTVRF